jgi:hypothetical protein
MSSIEFLSSALGGEEFSKDYTKAGCGAKRATRTVVNVFVHRPSCQDSGEVRQDDVNDPQRPKQRSSLTDSHDLLLEFFRAIGALNKQL